ncbi:MAG TPA: hypothetical protein PKH36_16640 [Flavobacteriales bacterium]|nr:hypothetical protein [Flavobacteriales bacterium]
MKALLALALCASISVNAQDQAATAKSVTTPPGAQWSMGLGAGLDYGGIGVQLHCRAARPLAVFLGGGYALAGFGLNAGAEGRVLPDARWCPIVSAMYGYNAVIVIEDAEEYNKLYYGPSFGLGVEVSGKRNNRNFLRLQLLLPLRPTDFKDDLDRLRRNPAIEIRSEPPDFGVSVAYHFGV